MVLRKTTIDIPLTGGVNQKIDSKNLPAPGFLELENVRISKDGSVGKRYGFADLGHNVINGEITSLSYTALANYNNELVKLSEDYLYSYSEQGSGWVSKGNTKYSQTTLRAVTGSAEDTSGIDSIINNNIQVITWLEGTTIYYSIIDHGTGMSIKDRQTLVTSASDIYPRLVSLGNDVHIFYNSGNDIKVLSIPTTSPASSFSTSTIYTTLDSTNDAFEVHSSGNYIYLVFLTTTASTCRVTKLDLNLTTVATNTFTATPTSSANLSVYISSIGAGYVDISWFDNTNVKTLRLTKSLVVAVATVTNSSTTGIVNVEVVEGKVYYTVSASPTSNYIIYSNSVGSTHGSQSVRLRSAGIISRGAAIVNSDGIARKYIVALHESTLQSTYFLLDASNGTPIGKFAAGKSTVHSKIRRPGNLTVFNTNSLLFGCGIKGRIESENAVLFSNMLPHLAEIDTQSSLSGGLNQINNTLLVSTGNLTMYDGYGLQEYGFNLYPESTTLTTATTPGAIPNGTYLVYALYEWTDNKGNRHQSAPSIASSVTLSSGDDTIDVAIPTLRITNKSSPGVIIRVFITEDNGTVAYNAGTIDNDSTTDSVSLQLVVDPASLASNEILYTTGGQVENLSAPSHKFHFLYDNRIVIGGLEDENQIRFSKNIKPLTGIGFNEDYLINIDPFGGKVKGGAATENAMVLFKETAIYAINGSGPNDTGAGSALSAPQLISSDIGCRDPKSILQAPEGIYFMSNKGIHLLDAGLNLMYIGYPVESYNNNTILSANIIPNENEIRFVTDTGVILVYNTFFQRWSITKAAGAVSATIWKNNTYVYLTQTTVMKEDSSTYLDNGSYVPMKVRTAWIRTKSIQGYQRMYRLGLLGTYHTDNAFNIKLYYNYSDTVKETHVVNASDIVNTTVYGGDALFGDSEYYGGSRLDEVYQLNKHLKYQKCESISIELVDSANGTNTGQGFSIEGISLQVGTKQGIFRNTSTRSI